MTETRVNVPPELVASRQEYTSRAIRSKQTPGSRNQAQQPIRLREIGFHRDPSGILLDSERRPVEFTLMVSSSNQLRRKMATLVQEDLGRQLLSQNLPLIFLVSPHVLAVAHRNLGNVAPAVMEPVLLWNCDRLFWIKPPE